jgi:hypothetical protein
MSTPKSPDLARLRGRPAVAASLLAVLLIGGYVASSQGAAGAPTGAYIVSAVVLVVTFWFPAMRIGSPRELASEARPLALWIAAWTLVWDLTTSGLLGERALFQEWWLVYPSGLVFFFGLLALHAAIVRRFEARDG